MAFVIRLEQHHSALLYPDGYQYLLMARGISEHFQPTTVLGHGGELFVPNADAAIKPVFPLAVAAVHAVGMSWLDAATLATVVAGAWAVTAVALLVRGLSGSTAAGRAAGALVIASPSVASWTGFSGPDPARRGAGLQLGARLRRPAGTSWGRPCGGSPLPRVRRWCCWPSPPACSRCATRRSRVELRRAAPAAVITASLVFAVLRTPATINDWRFALILPIALGALVLVTRAPPDVLRYGAVASVALMAVVLLDRPGTGDALAGRLRPLPRSSRLSWLLTLLRDRDQSSRGARRRRRRPPPRGRISGQEPCARPVLRSAPSRRRARGRSRACGPSWVDSAQPGSPSSRAWRRSVRFTPCPAAATTTCSPRSRAASRDASGTVGSPS